MTTPQCFFQYGITTDLEAGLAGRGVIGSCQLEEGRVVYQHRWDVRRSMADWSNWSYYRMDKRAIIDGLIDYLCSPKQENSNLVSVLQGSIQLTRQNRTQSIQCQCSNNNCRQIILPNTARYTTYQSHWYQVSNRILGLIFSIVGTQHSTLVIALLGLAFGWTRTWLNLDKEPQDFTVYRLVCLQKVLFFTWCHKNVLFSSWNE